MSKSKVFFKKLKAKMKKYNVKNKNKKIKIFSVQKIKNNNKK